MSPVSRHKFALQAESLDIKEDTEECNGGWRSGTSVCASLYTCLQVLKWTLTALSWQCLSQASRSDAAPAPLLKLRQFLFATTCFGCGRHHGRYEPHLLRAAADAVNAVQLTLPSCLHLKRCISMHPASKTM